MTPERWQKIKSILAEALDCEEPSARLAVVTQRCAGDDELQREVASFLAQQTDGLEKFAAGAKAFADDAALKQNTGRRIGAYELVSELGRGGMGAVWLARRADQRFEQQVAIKLLKRGTDTEEVLRRFQAERQILARLEHPGIARLFDGGETDDGLPFFVMEFIAGGKPLTTFARDAGLSVSARLELFRKVCAAVQFAHQNLVVHRDLKPGNILVTPEGEPKLLDFGIARLLESESEAWDVTIAENRRLTPAYASPEQARGEPITTASDVYSLGALLYELLTDQLPHQFANANPSRDEIARAIGGKEPRRPSLVAENAETRRQIRGDLDNIVLRAMAREPARRYSSASGLANDLVRHLAGRTVQARPDTLSYRSAKFVRRNKLPVAAAALLALALLGGVVATLREARIANRERSRAEKRFEQLRGLASSFLFELDDAIAQRPTEARKIVVERAREYLDSLLKDAGDDRSLERDLATAYQKLGDVQSQLDRANVGDSAGALASYRKSLSMREALLASSRAEGDREALRMELALSYRRLGDILAKTGDTGAALENYRKTLSLEMGAAAPSNPAARIALASSHEIIGRTLLRIGDAPNALTEYRQALAVLDPLLHEKVADPAARLEQAKVYLSLAYLLAEMGEKGKARGHYEQALDIVQSLTNADPTNPRLRRLLMDSHQWLGTGLRDSGDLAGALREYHLARTSCESSLQADPANVQTQNDLADILHNIGNTLFLAGDAVGALEHARLAKAHYEVVAAADSLNVHAQRQVVAVQEEIAKALALSGSKIEALTGLREACAAFRGLAAQDKVNTQFQRDVIRCEQELAELSVIQ